MKVTIIALVVLLNIATVILDFSGDFVLSYNGGEFSGHMNYSWASGFVIYNYYNGLYATTEQYFVPPTNSMNATVVSSNHGDSCLINTVITATPVSQYTIQYQISITEHGDYYPWDYCSIRRWGIEIPSCVRLVQISGCPSDDTPPCGDSYCGHFNNMGLTTKMFSVPDGCLGPKPFNITVYPVSGQSVSVDFGYIALYGCGYYFPISDCESLPLLSFSCKSDHTPVLSWTTYASNCSLYRPRFNQTAYSQPKLFYDPSYYINANDTLYPIVHYVKNNSVQGIVSDLFINSTNGLISKAYFLDGRRFQFSNVVNTTFPSNFSGTPPEACICRSPLDISLVLDKYTSWESFSNQREFALQFMLNFDLNPLSTQISVNYVDYNHFYQVLPLNGGGSEYFVNRSLLSIGCDNDNRFSSYCGGGYYNLTNRILNGINTLNVSRQYSGKILILFYNGYIGCGNEFQDGYDGWFRNVQVSPEPVSQINSVISQANSLGISVYFILTGAKAVLPAGLTGPNLYFFNTTDDTNLLNDLPIITADVCGLNPSPCGTCCGLCISADCIPPEHCDSGPSQCFPITKDPITGCCKVSPFLNCSANTNQCQQAFCLTNNQSCAVESSCPPDSSCFTYSCSQGKCYATLNAPDDSCLISECKTFPNGSSAVVSTQKCPNVNVTDGCYKYGCTNGTCTKVPYKQPTVGPCEILTCNGTGWQIQALDCPDFPELCLVGQCDTQLRSCVLVSTCKSVGCVTRHCSNNGSCLSTAGSCSTVSCTSATCNTVTGVCDYAPNCQPGVCQIVTDCITCTIAISQNCPANACLRSPTCKVGACSSPQCTTSGTCTAVPICKQQSGATLNCSVSTSGSPICTYTQASICPPNPTNGSNYVWSLNKPQCTLEPVVCASAIPGCTTGTVIYNTTTSQNECVQTFICNATGCPSQTCVYSTTTNTISGTCKTNPASCPDSDSCFECPPDSCDVEPIDCPSPDPCFIGQCSVYANNTGCYFIPISCDDGNPCTTDTCTNGNCTHTPCNDNNPCTTDSCNEAAGQCIFQLINCDDNNKCTFDSCNTTNGACLHTSIAYQCNDNNSCTNDSCDPFSGCVNSAYICPTTGLPGCSVAFCTVTNGQASCSHRILSCVYSIFSTPAIIGTSLAAAAIAGIVIGAVTVTAASGGVVGYVRSYAGNTDDVVTVSDNPHYLSQMSGGDNPLQSDLID